jgi:DNA repair exonuclease SbcCD ATPase subunit
MIIFKIVRYKNLLSTGNAFTEIDLNKDRTTLIDGKNGSGKSTVIDALCYGLYGKPFRKINKPQLVNTINNKEMVVEVEFDIGSDQYIVVRGMRPHRFEIYKNDELIQQDAAIKDYQAFLDKSILKLNHRSFCQVVVLGSATYIPFMQLKAWERRQIVEDLLDIQIFTNMNVLLKDRVSKNKDEQQKVKFDADLLKEREAMQLSLLKQLNANVEDQVKACQTKAGEVLGVIDGLEVKAIEVEQNIDDKMQQISDAEVLRNKASKLQGIRETMIEKLDALSKEITFYHDTETCPTCQQGIDHEFRVTKVQSKTDDAAKISTALPDLEGMYKGLEQQIAETMRIQTEINVLNRELAHTRSEQKLLTRRLAELRTEMETLKTSKKASSSDIDLDEIRKSIAGVETTRERLGRQSLVLSAASILLKDDGIKTKIIRQYIPLMNKLINKYLSALDFFVQFELDEQFNEKILSRFRDEFSYQSFSEGEKLRITLAILFTWRGIAKIRNSASTNLLIMDEVLDGSLDIDGTEDLLKMIKEITADTNLFVISHRADALADKFDNRLSFVKHGNFSTLEKAGL